MSTAFIKGRDIPTINQKYQFLSLKTMYPIFPIMHCDSIVYQTLSAW